MYDEFPMQIFGHAGSTELSTFHDLQDFYLENRDTHEITIFSQEKGKTKPATLFFLSKFGCEIEKVLFYNQLTKNEIWDEFDILLTSNPDLLIESENKTLIKYETSYNLTTECEHTITTLKDLDKKIETLIET